MSGGAGGNCEVQEASSGYQEVQKACLEVHKAGSGYLEVQEERTVKKICDDPFLVPFLVPVILLSQVPGPDQRTSRTVWNQV